MRRAPPPTTTGWQERVCRYSADAAAERRGWGGGGGQAWVQVCKGEGKMVVESEEEGREEPDGEERRDGDQGGAGAELGALCPGRKGCKQLGHPHAPSLPLNPCDHRQHQAQLISTPLWLCRPHCSLGPGHTRYVPASCCILSGERVIVPPYPARCALPTPGVLRVCPPAWGMNYCLGGAAAGGPAWGSRVDSVQQNPSHLLPSPCPLAPSPRVRLSAHLGTP